MSWLNLNNLSNIKGQISSFASGVLAEGIIGDNTEPSETHNEDQQVTIARLQEEIEKLKNENLQYQKVNSSLRKHVELEEDNDDGWSWDSPAPNLVDKGLLSELRQKNEKLEAERKELYNSLELLDVEYKEATEKLVSIKDNLQKENSKLKQDRDEIKQKNELLLKINEDAQKKLEFHEKQQRRENCEPPMEEICLNNIDNEHVTLHQSTQHEIHINELEAEILDLKKEVRNLKEDNSNLKLKDEENTLHLDSIIKVLINNFAVSQDDLFNIKSTNFIQNLAEIISDFKNNYQILKELSDNLQKDLLESKAEVELLKDDKLVMSKHLSENKAELQDLKKKSTEALKELALNREELEFNHTKCKEQTAELSMKQEELNIFKNKYEELSKQLSTVEESYNSCKIENASLSQELSLNREELNHFKAENELLSNNLTINQEEIKNLKNKPEGVLKELSKIKQELKHYKTECEELSKNNDALIDKIQENNSLLPISENNEDSLVELEQELEVSKKEIHDLKTVIENSKIVTEVDDLQKQLNQTSDELDVTRKKYEHLKSFYQQLEQDNSHLKTNLEDMKLTYDVCCNEKDDLNTAVDQIKFEFENTEYKYAEQNINMETLNEEIETHLMAIDKLKEENKNLLVLNEDANSKMELSQKEIEDLKQELTSVLETMEDKEEEIKQLNELLISSNETENIKNKLEELQAHETNLLLQISKSNSLLENVTKERDDLETNFKSVKLQLENFKVEHLNCTNVINQLTNEKSILNDTLTQMKEILCSKHDENVKYHEEIKRLQQALSEQVENYQAQLQNINDKLPSKESLDKKNEEIEHLFEQNVFLNEKCKKLTDILVQEQNKVAKLMAEKSSSGEIESILKKKLDDLRKHLLEMEHSYMEEIQKTEEKFEEMKLKLQQAEEREKNSSNRYTSVNIRANQQVETLQTQLQLVTNQRDELRAKVSELEDEIGKKNAALVNLQIVLQQFQREKEADIHNETERIRRQITLEKDKQVSLQKDINDLKSQLEESKEALKAATRLSEQVNVYKEQVNSLKNEVDNLQLKLKKSEQQCASLISRTDAKVDKLLVKNLILGFISSNNYSYNKDQSQILKIISSVLDFNQSDMDKAKMNASVQNSWLDALLHPKFTESGTNSQESLSQAFVKFLQEESTPKNLPNLLDATSTVKQESASSNEATNKRQSPIVLNEIVLPTFADFGRNRNSSSILKDVLKDNT